MKTPREMLLARHRAVEPKLDVVRERALVALSPGQARPPSFGRRWLATCREFLHIPRVAWAGLAAAWLVIIALNASSNDMTVTATASVREAKRTPENLQAWREQKRLFAELVGSGEGRDADVPRFVPRPRSERQPQMVFA